MGAKLRLKFLRWYLNKIRKRVDKYHSRVRIMQDWIKKDKQEIIKTTQEIYELESKYLSKIFKEQYPEVDSNETNNKR